MIDDYLTETKQTKTTTKMDNKIFMKMLLMLITLCSFNAIAQAGSRPAIPVNSMSKEASWICQGCQKSCWSNQTDWKGDYHCNGCGKKKG